VSRSHLPGLIADPSNTNICPADTSLEHSSPLLQSHLARIPIIKRSTRSCIGSAGLEFSQSILRQATPLSLRSFYLTCYSDVLHRTRSRITPGPPISLSSAPPTNTDHVSRKLVRLVSTPFVLHISFAFAGTSSLSSSLSRCALPRTNPLHPIAPTLRASCTRQEAERVEAGHRLFFSLLL
jgi:hypothetical protein